MTTLVSLFFILSSSFLKVNFWMHAQENDTKNDDLYLARVSGVYITLFV